nr:SWIM zinc finger family protein [Lachnoclostridium phocaeense]
MVEGTDDYEVDLEIEEGEVCEMYCSCPYAEDGNNCKHMAAVLYEIEEQSDGRILTEEKFPGCQKEELEEIIENVPEKELRSFIKGIAAHNNEIRDLLMTRYASKIDEKQMNRLKQGVDDLVWKYGDRSGYIDYRNALDFIWALERYLEELAVFGCERIGDTGES